MTKADVMKRSRPQEADGERWAMTLVAERQFAHELPRSVVLSLEVVLTEFIRKERQGLAKQARVAVPCTCARLPADKE